VSDDFAADDRPGVWIFTIAGFYSIVVDHRRPGAGAIDYSSFKNEVAARQGRNRTMRISSVMHRLQEDTIEATVRIPAFQA